MTDYSQKGHYYIDTARPEVIRLSHLLQDEALILDVGAGYANNAQFLLANGYGVTALETNKEAIKYLKQLAKTYHQLKVTSKSIDTYRTSQQYDAIVCCMVLHFLDSRRAAKKGIKDMQAWTKPSGLNLITSYITTDKLTDDYSFLLQEEELRILYADWEILWYEESYPRSLKNAQTLKGMLRLAKGQKGYKAARIIARKPNKQ